MRTVRGSKFRELWDRERKNGHAIVTGLDFDAYVSKRNTIPDIVSFRVDTQAWLDSLTEAQRERALDLADGTRTGELAQRWGVSPCAVSLYRRQLNQSYERFMSH